jgi:hypothetical protein
MKDGIIEQLDTPAKIVKDWLDFFVVGVQDTVAPVK